jgi:hypothetical protein
MHLCTPFESASNSNSFAIIDNVDTRRGKVMLAAVQWGRGRKLAEVNGGAESLIAPQRGDHECRPRPFRLLTKRRHSMIEFQIEPEIFLPPTFQQNAVHLATRLEEQAGGPEVVPFQVAIRKTSNRYECSISGTISASLTALAFAIDSDPYLALKTAVDRAVTSLEKMGFNGPPMPTPDFAIVWDPAIVSPEQYAELVEIVGDLVRANGGAGIRRVMEEEIGVIGAGVCQL